jgi:hypothetical protein
MTAGACAFWERERGRMTSESLDHSRTDARLRLGRAWLRGDIRMEKLPGTDGWSRVGSSATAPCQPHVEA